MARYGGTISLRLAVGFALVLGVLGAAMLLMLSYLDSAREASEEIRERQEVRREALEIGRAAEELLLQQRDFLAAPGVDWDKVAQFQDLYSRTREMLESLQARSAGAPERTYLEELAQAAAELNDLFLNEIVGAKIRVEQGVEPEETLLELERQSRQSLEAIGRLNEHIAYVFEARTRAAEDQATSAWTISIAVAKIIFPVALLICLLVIYYTHRSILEPVSALLRGTKQLASGDLGGTIEVKASGEFRELADSFNRMARALEAHQKQLIESEKLASVGRLAAGVAHEINNPIAVILGYAQMLHGSCADDDPEREQLETIVQEARLCKNIVGALLGLARPSEATEGEAINPRELMDEVLNLLGALQVSEGVQVEKSVIDRELALGISRPRLRQLALNITRNGMEALQSAEDGLLRIEGYVRPRQKLPAEALQEPIADVSSFLVLLVADNGPGIPPQNLATLFEPFFTTKADGMGLGLAISYNIARAHGGFIQVESAVGEGTTFTVGLPVAEEG